MGRRRLPRCKRANIPSGGLKYWVALSAASVLGCNTGDLFSSAFGFVSGLPLLAAGFLSVLWLERRATRPAQAYYWLAIIAVRTAATNLADFLGQSFGIAGALATLAALLLAAVLVGQGGPAKSANPASSNMLPAVDAVYWFRMLIAGTLGTALGDMSSFMSGMGLGGASLALSALAVGLIAARSAGALTSTLSYWFVVVAIRAAGTSLGDFSAHQNGLATSTAVSALVLASILFFRPRNPVPALGPVAARP